MCVCVRVLCCAPKFSGREREREGGMGWCEMREKGREKREEASGVFFDVLIVIQTKKGMHVCADSDGDTCSRGNGDDPLGFQKFGKVSI